LSDEEYRRLSAVPFAAMTREESLKLCGEIRRRQAGIKFYLDPREFQGHHYWERGFLSCVMSGANIPQWITPELFRIPRNLIIFRALQELEKLDITGLDALIVFLRETGRLGSADGEGYVRGVESMIGLPSAARGFAEGLLRLNLGARI
jgi:hypothetical protein